MEPPFLDEKHSKLMRKGLQQDYLLYGSAKSVLFFLTKSDLLNSHCSDFSSWRTVEYWSSGSFNLTACMLSYNKFSIFLYFVYLDTLVLVACGACVVV